MSDDEDIDVQAILARINSNLNMEENAGENSNETKPDTTETISIEESQKISELVELSPARSNYL